MIFKASILVVEDNPTNLELMVYLLNAFGYSPREACDGVECLEAVERERPDLILLDVHLPRMDGYETVCKIRSDPRLRSIPVLAVTALAMVGDKEKLLAAGSDGYLSKPIDPENFVSQMERFLGADFEAGVRAPAAVSGADPAPPPAPRGITILAVDNVRANLTLLQGMLEPLGYTVLTAPAVLEALTLARKSPPDLILTDIHMPHQDGFDLLRQVRDDPLLKDTPVIFTSASLESEVSRTIVKNLPTAHFLTRPIEPRALLAEIEAAIKARRRR